VASDSDCRPFHTLKFSTNHLKMGRGGSTKECSKSDDNLIPVTLLCGFLGSGKTTLLKHILETKHEEEDFKCAVIVNDMAELNIDKSLIDQTALIQSDEAMIGMQNGCICCSLQSDLVEQIIGLTQKKKFNYILIEASGVSEPHKIAPLFELEDHDHDHDDADLDHDHDKPQLGEVARLDTCVTLIDSADFYNNLGSMKTYEDEEQVGTIAELMMDQVEFANVIILNKGDLVNEDQKSDLFEKIKVLNPQAKIMKSVVQSQINVKDIINTHLYKDKEEFWVTSTKHAETSEETTGRRVPEASRARFDINSFVYRARRPFNPSRLNHLFLEPYFMIPWYAEAESESEDENEKKTEEEIDKLEKEKDIKFQKIQKEAHEQQKKRNKVMGDLLRSKGFIWMATSHDMMGGWQQAGNVLRIEPETPWMCDEQEQWEGTALEDQVLKYIQKENGEDWEYKDRRQEIVFIGHGMKQDTIQKLLDECLLTDEEMALGPEGWKETMEDLSNFKFFLEDAAEEEEEEEEEENDKELEEGIDKEFEEEGNEEVLNNNEENASLNKGKKRKLGNDSRPSNDEKEEEGIKAIKLQP